MIQNVRLPLCILTMVLLYFIDGAIANSEIEEWRKELAIHSVKTRSMRLNIAKGLKKDIMRLDGFLPTLTSSQREWVENELNKLILFQGEIYDKKLGIFMTSNEGMIYGLHSLLTNIIHTLDYVIKPNQNSQSTVDWLIVVDQLLKAGPDVNRVLYILMDRHIIKLSKRTRKHLRLGGILSLWTPYYKKARLISSHIVIPLLTMNQPKHLDLTLY